MTISRPSFYYSYYGELLLFFIIRKLRTLNFELFHPATQSLTFVGFYRPGDF